MMTMMVMTAVTMMMMMVMTVKIMLTWLRMMYIRLRMIDDASMEASGSKIG